MKKIVAITLMLLLLGSELVFGQITRTLIDFSQYEDKISQVLAREKQTFDQLAQEYQKQGRDLYEEWLYGQKDAQKLIIQWFDPENWKMDNWKVELAPSAQFSGTVMNSYAKKVISKNWNDQPVLGVRINFPRNRFLSWAIIKPPFEFFPYYDDGKPVDVEADFSTNVNPDDPNVQVKSGVLMNVLDIKRVSAWVAGRNYLHQFSVLLKNEDGETEEYFLGSLYFSRWRKLVWENPHYIPGVQHRMLRRVPLYPRTLPYKELAGFVVYKPQEEPGGDFVVYIKSVEVTFDRAVVQEELDIDDEAYWHILSEQKLKYKKGVIRRIFEQLELMETEKKRQQASQASQTYVPPQGGGGR